MTTYAYARVSTLQQNHRLQLDAFAENGIPIERTVSEYASGSAARPKLRELLNGMQEGDTLCVWKLDRMGRGLRDLLAMVDELERRGIDLRSLQEGIYTGTPAGRLVWQVFGAVAEYERTLTIERVKGGVKAAQARGVHCGRPPALTPVETAVAAKLIQEGATRKSVAERFRVSRATLRNHLDQHHNTAEKP